MNKKRFSNTLSLFIYLFSLQGFSQDPKELFHEESKPLSPKESEALEQYKECKLLSETISEKIADHFNTPEIKNHKQDDFYDSSIYEKQLKELGITNQINKYSAEVLAKEKDGFKFSKIWTSKPTPTDEHTKEVIVNRIKNFTACLDSALEKTRNEYKDLTQVNADAPLKELLPNPSQKDENVLIYFNEKFNYYKSLCHKSHLPPFIEQAIPPDAYTAKMAEWQAEQFGRDVNKKRILKIASSGKSDLDNVFNFTIGRMQNSGKFEYIQGQPYVKVSACATGDCVRKLKKQLQNEFNQAKNNPAKQRELISQHNAYLERKAEADSILRESNNPYVTAFQKIKNFSDRNNLSFSYDETKKRLNFDPKFFSQALPQKIKNLDSANNEEKEDTLALIKSLTILYGEEPVSRFLQYFMKKGVVEYSKQKEALDPNRESVKTDPGRYSILDSDTKTTPISKEELEYYRAKEEVDTPEKLEKILHQRGIDTSKPLVSHSYNDGKEAFYEQKKVETQKELEKISHEITTARKKVFDTFPKGEFDDTPKAEEPGFLEYDFIDGIKHKAKSTVSSVKNAISPPSPSLEIDPKNTSEMEMRGLHTFQKKASIRTTIEDTFHISELQTYQDELNRLIEKTKNGEALGPEETKYAAPYPGLIMQKFEAAIRRKQEIQTEDGPYTITNFIPDHIQKSDENTALQLIKEFASTKDEKEKFKIATDPRIQKILLGGKKIQTLQKQENALSELDSLYSNYSSTINQDKNNAELYQKYYNTQAAIPFGNLALIPNRQLSKTKSPSPIRAKNETDPYSVIPYDDGNNSFTTNVKALSQNIKNNIEQSRDLKKSYTESPTFRMIWGTYDIGHQLVTRRLSDLTEEYLSAHKTSDDYVQKSAEELLYTYGVPRHQQLAAELQVPYSIDSMGIDQQKRTSAELRRQAWDQDLGGNLEAGQGLITSIAIGGGISASGRYLANLKRLNDLRKTGALVPTTKIGAQLISGATTALPTAMLDTYGAVKGMAVFSGGINAATNVYDFIGSEAPDTEGESKKFKMKTLGQGWDHSFAGLFDPTMTALGVGLPQITHPVGQRVSAAFAKKGAGAFTTRLANEAINQGVWVGYGVHGWSEQLEQTKQLEESLKESTIDYNKQKNYLQAGFTMRDGATRFDPEAATKASVELIKKISTLSAESSDANKKLWIHTAGGVGYPIGHSTWKAYKAKTIPQLPEQALAKIGYKEKGPAPKDIATNVEIKKLADRYEERYEKTEMPLLVAASVQNLENLKNGSISHNEFTDINDKIFAKYLEAEATVQLARGRIEIYEPNFNELDLIKSLRDKKNPDNETIYLGTRMSGLIPKEPSQNNAQNLDNPVTENTAEAFNGQLPPATDSCGKADLLRIDPK